MKRGIFSKIMVGTLAFVAWGSAVVYAATAPTSVTIYTNQSSATSTSIYCSGYIDGFGVNDDTSTNGLYYTLRFKEAIGTSEAYSKLMKPGTGDMGSSSVNTWYTIFSQRTVMNGNGNYSVKLNPKGAYASGCYGAGKLVD